MKTTLALLIAPTLLLGTWLTIANPVARADTETDTQSASTDTAHAEGRDARDLSWLAGEWQGDMWGGRFSAHYSTPDGGRILSYSWLTKEGRVAYYEFEVFDMHRPKTRLQPYPGGKPAVGFDLQSHDAGQRKAVFENPEKDFPTRIVYHRVADDRLQITLSDPFGKSDKVEVFDLQRQIP